MSPSPSLDLPVRLGGATIVVRVSGDRSTAVRLGRFYRVRPRTARGDADVELRWERGRGDVRRGGRLVRRSERRDELCLWLEWAATCEALRRPTVRIPLHSAWVVRGRRGLLVAGPHASGKTSLALELARRHRWRIGSEDVVLLRSRGRVTPFCRPIRLKRRTGIRLVPLPASRGRTDRRPDAILLLRLPHGGPLRCRRLGEGLAVAKLARLTMTFRERPRESLASLGSLVRGVPVWEVRGGTLRDRSRMVPCWINPLLSAPPGRILAWGSR